MLYKISTFLLVILIIFLVPQTASAQAELTDELLAPTPVRDEFFRGKVIKIEGERQRQEFGANFLTQDITVLINNGQDQEIRIPYEIDLNKEGRRQLEVGDQVIIGKNTIAGDSRYYVSDIYRLNGLWPILVFFFVVTVIFAGRAGVRSFIGLAISFAVIMLYIIPQILAGQNPFLVSLIGTIGIACSSLYVAHGFRLRTTVAFISTIITIGLALVLSYVFVEATRLFGLGSEEALFLQFGPTAGINLRGLLLGGIIIGTLGVLDDITTAQAAAVEEIHKANTELGFAELYRRGLSVGREHIISLVNTLVLAYTGASFPLFLLFKTYQGPFWLTLNSEIILEEVIRMLVGSIALIFAVPITTALAAYIFHQRHLKK